MGVLRQPGKVSTVLATSTYTFLPRTYHFGRFTGDESMVDGTLSASLSLLFSRVNLFLVLASCSTVPRPPNIKRSTRQATRDPPVVFLHHESVCI